MKRRRALVALASLCGGAASAAAALSLAGCPNTASTTIYTPPTGIQIDSQELVAGIGCGSGPGQVYGYAAIVTQVTETGTPFVTSAVSNCFGNPIFTNLPSPDGGLTQYSIAIYAFDSASFPPELGGCENVPLTSACPGEDASVVRRYESQANWTTTCTATQAQGVPQVADCGQLEPTEAGPGGEAGSEGGPDAADAGNAADAGEAGDAANGADAAAADAFTAEASDGAGVSGEAGDAPLE